MSSPLSLQIKCPVCLSDFTDPVMLSCEHSFCRQCITGHMTGSHGRSLCPECRKPYVEKDLQSSRLLTNMTDCVRQHLIAPKQEATLPTQTSQGLGDMLMCPEHDEKLKLFCETDSKLVCVVCRDGAKHRDHNFKPVKEAAQITKGIVKSALGYLVNDNDHLMDMAQKQATEVSKTQMRSKEISNQVSAQFEEMHRFLKKQEEEIKRQLEAQEQGAVTTMCKNVSVINERLMDGRELQCIFQSALDIKQPDLFLQWWNEKGLTFTERMTIKNNMTPDIRYKSQAKDLNVMPHSFFFGPYETHLQFFVWKTMLGVIKPVPEFLHIKAPRDTYLKVSPGGSSVRQADRQSTYYKNYNPGVVSEETFQSGQHYWEIEVGNKKEWSIGVKTGVQTNSKNQSVKSKDPNDVYLELINDVGYSVSTNNKTIPMVVRGKPSKIGLYLDCDRKQISFFDADIMTRLFITSYSSTLPCAISFFPGVYLDGTNIDPVTVCSYGSHGAHSLL